MDVNVIFSDDRGECLKHYGRKGMKWHKHIFGKNVEDARSGWERDTKVKVNGQFVPTYILRTPGIVSTAASSLRTANMSIKNAKKVASGKRLVARVFSRVSETSKAVNKAKKNVRSAKSQAKNLMYSMRAKGTGGGKF